MPLLRTKLYLPPARPEWVPRPRLIERMQAVHSGCKLILVSAPAGFGKTTLIGEWADRANLPVAWVSLDPGDDDLFRFWRYVLAALQTVDASIEVPLDAPLGLSRDALDTVGLPSRQVQPPSPNALVTALLNELAARPTPLALVLDDYHAISDLAVHKSVAFLLDHLPRRVLLVLSTREDPPLPLSRLRARGQMLEVRASDLRFSRAEAALFFSRTMELDLSPQDVAALEAKTEGWVAGLQLAALSLRDQVDRPAFIHRFAGDDRLVMDYLIDEVLSRQPEEIQGFLLHTSLLERLCGALCDAVTQRDDSQAILERLARANLFLVPLDTRGRWYRYHALFAELLRSRLEAAQGSSIRELHRRASEWYQERGEEGDAVGHALAARDFERAAELVRHCAGPLLYAGEATTLLGWLGRLPEDVYRTRPMLCIHYAWALLRSRRDLAAEEIRRWLQNAQSALEAGVPRAGWTAQSLADEVGAESAVIRATLASRAHQGDWSSTIALWRHTLAHLPAYKVGMRAVAQLHLGKSHLNLGEPAAAALVFDEVWRQARQESRYEIAATAARWRAYVARRQGHLHDAVAVCRDALREIAVPAEGDGRPLSAAGILHISLGRITLEQGKREEAGRLLTIGLERIGSVGWLTSRAEGLVARARLKQIEGDVEGAQHYLDRVETVWPEAGSGAYAAALRVQLWTALSQRDPSLLSRAETWAARVGDRFDVGRGVLAVVDEWQYARALALIRLQIARRRLRGAPDLRRVLEFLKEQLQIHEASGLNECAIELLVLLALALDAQGRTGHALDALQRALALAEPQGYFYLFVDEGAPMARLLYEAARQTASVYVGRLLAAFEPEMPGQGSLSSGPDADLVVEPLTARELDVLQLIGQGLSNREIAQRLVISPSTAKRHTSKLYAKLCVHSRTQAVAKARLLGLLS